MTRADLKHCGKIPDAREELNRSVREGRIESRREWPNSHQRCDNPTNCGKCDCRERDNVETIVVCQVLSSITGSDRINTHVVTVLLNCKICLNKRA